MLLSVRTESNQRTAGAAFGERVLTGGLPRTPFYGGVSLWIAETFRRAKSSSVSVLFPGLRPYCPQNLEATTSTVHRLVPAYLFGAAGIGRA